LLPRLLFLTATLGLRAALLGPWPWLFEAIITFY